tara:strand:+ start:95291 stop:97348 length:2058 start_codon:yes stop_codon:yes gene_type:complete
VSELHGVGKQLTEKLAKLDIHSVQDILFHLPSRYQDRTRITPMRNLRHGDHAVIEGEVLKADVAFGKKRSLNVTLKDASGFVQLRFFYFNKAQQQQLKTGVRLRCFGEARSWQGGCTMIHPEYRQVKKGEPLDVAENLTPIYPTTEGLNQNKWRQLSDQALAYVERDIAIADYLPEAILKQYQLMNLKDALLYVHRPPPDADQPALVEGVHPAQQRLAFEELLAFQLSMQQLRKQAQQYEAPILTAQTDCLKRFQKNLSFELTNAQQRVVKDITDDIVKPVPMLRLIQGDVGSGKTVVAAIAALLAVDNDYQVAIMAPTELLAGQHLINFTAWLEPLGIRVGWLSGSLTVKQRRSSLENIAMGLDQVIIGTHALFQEAVEFKQLALVIIDEQHRFGVHQRLALHDKGKQGDVHPHQLIMTATPIPRTLAMTAYADLDTSVIDELPPGRTPVKTAVVGNTRRQEVVERVNEMCQAGGQVYWVCTLIEESENLQCQAAEDATSKLRAQLPELNIGLVHGRMSAKEKEQVMTAFANNELQLLVATTVIEVGVNVPNATLMIIENAERLGLAQLHQLRGRVGRGAKESHCVLLYQAPLSHIAKDRLTTMRETTDGFKIAEKDLQIRGPGEVLGTRQTGLQQFQIADILRDQGLLPEIQQLAGQFISQYPEQSQQLIQRWVGSKQQFAHA